MINAKSKRLFQDQEEERALDAKILAVSRAEKISDLEEQQRLKLQRRRAQFNYMKYLTEQVCCFSVVQKKKIN